jgi:hypothetical protein
MEVENINRGRYSIKLRIISDIKFCLIGPQPMKDYNKASSMQLRIIENCYDNMKILSNKTTILLYIV